MNTYQADLLVIGGGMAGITAAYHAARHGAEVVVIEKAPAIGGSAALSGGYLWTATSFEQLRLECPLGDPVLGRAFIEAFPALVEWVRSTGVTFSDEVDVLYGRGWQVDLLTYLHRGAAAVEAAGGLVRVGTEVETLLSDGDRVVGARVRDDSGTTDVHAPWTLLATGGFQGDRALLQKYLGDRSAHLLLRSNPYSSGDGLRLGQAAGAVTSSVMDAFYGHLIAAPLPQFTEREFGRFALLYSADGALLNIDGERFTQEWLGDHVNAQRVARQPQGRAVLVIDEHLRGTVARAPVVRGSEAVDTIAEATRAGAWVASAETLAELADAVAPWGVRADRLPAAVEEFNAEAARPLGPGPYHAVGVRAGITFTQGGLRIDGAAHVLDAAETPVPGLLAAGADTGGVHNGGYAGGLALAGVFGMKAALAAAGVTTP